MLENLSVCPVELQCPLLAGSITGSTRMHAIMDHLTNPPSPVELKTPTHSALLLSHTQGSTGAELGGEPQSGTQSTVSQSTYRYQHCPKPL
ncbi:hypothetical protein JZ751_022066 [Albula glossodonta]|uniref:Uncharacterized protein n=1 Tax=Albula glossodonta TaxID=121402 RepID=A0A8T2MUA2_9TELE|nr:hypothetical protein JZ751_022066 [Albula glossodonta]